ncbi:MAG: ATP adenylyltransferase [Glaciecola sp.]
MTGDEQGRPDLDPRAAGQPAPADGFDRLWAPWRFGYVSGEGDKPRIEGCPFCVLPDRSAEHDRESLILHRGERAYVIANAYPYNPGHLMVIPYAHQADLEMLDQDTADEVWNLSRRSVAVLKERFSAQGVNLGANLGSVAGAGIAPHLHMHLVPRWGGDTNFISVIGAARVLPQALAEVYDRLLGAWD